MPIAVLCFTCFQRQLGVLQAVLQCPVAQLHHNKDSHQGQVERSFHQEVEVVDATFHTASQEAQVSQGSLPQGLLSRCHQTRQHSERAREAS